MAQNRSNEATEAPRVLTRRIGPLMVADLLCALLLAIPWLFSPWPIGTDLPQHAAQINLLERALSGEPNLGVHWFAPNSLVYWLLAPCVWLFGPVGGTKLLSWSLVSAATSLSLRLCAQRGMPVGLAVIAGVFLFNSNLYWGFLPFQLGWIVFLGWLLLLLSPAQNTWPRLVGFGFVSALLLAAHSLWFGAAAVAGAVVVAVRPRLWKQRLARGLTAIPTAAVALWWAPQMRESRIAVGFDVTAQWRVELAERFTPEFLASAVFGNILGDYVGAVAVLVLLGALVLSQFRGSDEARIDRELVALAAVMALAVLFLPDVYVNSLDFARRWAPHAAALALMGGVTMWIPVWRPATTLPHLALLAAAAPLTIAVIWTATVWNDVARLELNGLRDAIDAIEVEHPRTVGLNHLGKSRFLRGTAFLQQFAWVQAFHGGTLNFSFTEHGSGLVYEIEPTERPWTVGLEWLPHRFRPRDLEHFDVMLVGARRRQHERFLRNNRLRPLNENGAWRTYLIADE